MTTPRPVSATVSHAPESDTEEDYAAVPPKCQKHLLSSPESESDRVILPTISN
ncbi:hypothetical protein DPMN_044938 [Dreissena polymorpha]|uniref:Uncharacterized protein n=1 Tax=Dreissena polymorpha TaxID=45954 RepID=A0A9D4D5C3_DREPO|nr:hypothetical protein DPMN_044938 [Dreissena polymorpha]